jgi:hypothetical protein
VFEEPATTIAGRISARERLPSDTIDALQRRNPQ